MLIFIRLLSIKVKNYDKIIKVVIYNVLNKTLNKVLI